MIAIIDYEAGNIKSVDNAMKYLGREAVLTRDRDIIAGADRVILPGVGAFGDAMSRIREFDLEEVIHHASSCCLNPARKAPAWKAWGSCPAVSCAFPTGKAGKCPRSAGTTWHTP